MRPQADGWEADVAALVAHSTEGSALLRDRLPGQRVELMPHGCPTWFPPRKPHRGRVVGTFGFLEPQRGLTALVDAATALGDVELLLIGSTRAVWADDWFAGLDLPGPVRRRQRRRAGGPRQRRAGRSGTWTCTPPCADHTRPT